ncbi:sodium- and chloride-dependent GABA transporter 2-like [Athalia rosae]|uniref:sodium- and chloride-dependent GABA transporter 2-like n=1 Tax=Athalia rosae TaxID=37344 RepID=UPI0020339A06|nr:sodium- and chloride-dependent GABA transporter 2-like [Athalia rosae]
MSASIMYARRWFEQLTTMEEQIFRKTIKSADVNKIEDHHKSQALHWNFSDLLLIMSCFQLDLIYLCNMHYIFKNDLNPSFLQSIIMYGTWGIGLVYMELFVGQYVQRSCLYLKHMSPLTCSTIGYGMLLTMYCFCIAAVSRLADSYMFLFRSFGPELPWMMCPEGASTETCIDRAVFMKCYLEDKQKDCYPNIKPELLSSAIYYKARNSFSGNAILLLCAWLTIYIAMKRNLSDTRIVRN